MQVIIAIREEELATDWQRKEILQVTDELGDFIPIIYITKEKRDLGKEMDTL